MCYLLKFVTRTGLLMIALGLFLNLLRGYLIDHHSEVNDLNDLWTLENREGCRFRCCDYKAFQMILLSLE